MPATVSADTSNWHDSGCRDHMFPSCLDCPLVRCRYEDDPDEDWDRALTSIEQLMKAEGVSRRTAYRLRAKERVTA